MQTLIIILIVVMILNEIIAVCVYLFNSSEKKQAAAAQESIKNMHADFINEKHRFEKIIDEQKEIIKRLSFRCEEQAARIKEMEEERTIIISGDIKGTDTDGGVVGENGPLPNLE